MKTPHNHAVVVLALLASACGTTTPQIDARFSEASNALKSQQMRDPAAAVRNEARLVDGVGGQAASNAVDQYNKSFTKPAPSMTIMNMGVVGGSGWE